MKKNWPTIALITVVLFWGLSFSLTKPLLEYMGVFTFLSYRFVIGGISLLAFLIVRRRFALSRTLVAEGTLAGILLFAAFVLHTLGLKYTSISKNAFIVGSVVIFIPFLKIAVYRVKQGVSQWLQALLAAGGLALITLNGASGALNFGDIVTLGGTLIFAYYTLFVEARIKNHKPLVFTAVQLLTVGALSFVSMLVFEAPALPHSPADTVSVLIMGIGMTGLAYVIANMSQQSLPALKVTIIYTLEPLFASFFGWVMLAEHISANIYMGASLILMSMMITSKYGKMKVVELSATSD